MNDDGILRLEFTYHAQLREQFKHEQLHERWAKRYPLLFDKVDCQLAKSQCNDGFHFFEWLGAILLHEATGYLSLNQKYWSKKHARKLAIYEQLVTKNVRDVDHESGWPDLLMYAPDHSDWFFCETKGSDKLGEAQRRCFRDLHQESGKKVRLLTFKKLRK